MCRQKINSGKRQTNVFKTRRMERQMKHVICSLSPGPLLPLVRRVAKRWTCSRGGRCSPSSSWGPPLPVGLWGQSISVSDTFLRGERSCEGWERHLISYKVYKVYRMPTAQGTKTQISNLIHMGFPSWEGIKAGFQWGSRHRESPKVVHCRAKFRHEFMGSGWFEAVHMSSRHLHIHFLHSLHHFNRCLQPIGNLGSKTWHILYFMKHR